MTDDEIPQLARAQSAWEKLRGNFQKVDETAPLIAQHGGRFVLCPGDEPGFHVPARYETVKKTGIPSWARENWRVTIAFFKQEVRATDAVLRALQTARVQDLNDMRERWTSMKKHLKRSVGKCAPRGETSARRCIEKAGTREERRKAKHKASREACERTAASVLAFQRYEEAEREYHCRWVALEAIRVAAEAEPASKRDAYSLRSIRAGLEPADRRTWETLRKLVERPSKSTGKRIRGPSLERRAFEQWATAHSEQWRLLHEVIFAKESVAYLACRQGVACAVVLKDLRHALGNLRRALERSKCKLIKKAKCPQKLPRYSIRENASGVQRSSSLSLSPTISI